MTELNNEFYELIVKKSRRDRKVTVFRNEKDGSIHVNRDDMSFNISIQNDKTIDVKLSGIEILKVYLSAKDEPLLHRFNKNYKLNKKDLNVTVNSILTDMRTCPAKKNLVKASSKFVKFIGTMSSSNKTLMKSLIDKHM